MSQDPQDLKTYGVTWMCASVETALIGFHMCRIHLEFAKAGIL